MPLDKSLADSFIPTANERVSLAVVEKWGDGPLCECPRDKCLRNLPLAAWMYVDVEGQYVVLPGHQTPGHEYFELEGFTVEEKEPKEENNA